MGFSKAMKAFNWDLMMIFLFICITGNTSSVTDTHFPVSGSQPRITNKEMMLCPRVLFPSQSSIPPHISMPNSSVRTNHGM